MTSTANEATERAERATVGAILLSPALIDGITEIVAAEDFYRGAYRTLYEIAVALHQRGEPVDAITVTDELERTGRLEDAGGYLGVTDLLHEVPTAAHGAHYARRVAAHAARRRMRDAARELLELAAQDPGDQADASELADHAVAAVDRTVRKGRREGRRPRPTSTVLADSHPAGGSGVPLPWPSPPLPARLIAGELTLIGGPTGIGSTTFAAGLAAHTTAEMPGHILAATPGTPAVAYSQLAAALADYYRGDPSRIVVDDRPNLTVAMLRATARSIDHLDLLLVDPLQMLHPDQPGEQRQMQVAAIGRDLKRLAADLHVPVVAVSQLSRAPDRRPADQRRPRLGDLRDSGTLETDADHVWLLWHGHTIDRAELIVAKNRRGAPDSLPLRRLPLDTGSDGHQPCVFMSA